MSQTAERSAVGWTARQIRQRLGISTAIYQKKRLGAGEIAAIRERGIRRIELLIKQPSFDFEDRHQVSEVLGECEKQGVAIVSVHGSLELDYRAEDETTRRQVIGETLNSIRFAEEVGASVFVAHFGWNENTERTVTELLGKTDGCHVRLTTENMAGKIERYLPVVEEIGAERFGLTLDVGHARDAEGRNPFARKHRARRALAQCGAGLLHLHLHETFDLEQKRDHWPPLHERGIIAWGEVFAALRDIDYRGELLFEDGRGEDPEEWSQMTGAFPESFVARYAG